MGGEVAQRRGCFGSVRERRKRILLEASALRGIQEVGWRDGSGRAWSWRLLLLLLLLLVVMPLGSGAS